MADASLHVDPSVSAEQFWLSKQDDPMVYKVTKESYKSRVALLITNITFRDKSMNRKGAEVDHRNMDKQLTDLGYEVVKYTNLTGKEMDEALKKFAQHPKLKDTDSVVVVLMSHGERGVLLGVNYSHKEPDEFPVDNIYKHLGSKNCPALVDKPKIIIADTCREEDPPSESDRQNVHDDGIVMYKERDFIVLLSHTPDTKSFRSPADGSLLIQNFIAQCNETANQDHIVDLITKVLHRFDKLEARHLQQMPVIDRSSLRRHFYFFPGLCVRS